MKKQVYHLAFILFLTSCSSSLFKRPSKELTPKVETKTLSKMISGWPAMVKELKAYQGDITALRGRSYDLTFNVQGKWNLVLLPARAFSLKLTQESPRAYKVTIIDPNALYDFSGGLQRMHPLTAELNHSANEQGDILLDSDVSCLYQVKFIQGDKKRPIDFKKVQERYHYNFILSDSELITYHSQFASSAWFKRRASLGAVMASLQLELTDKRTQEKFVGKKVYLPACHKGDSLRPLSTNSGPRAEAIVSLTPGECMHYLGREFKALRRGKDIIGLRAHESFHNSCTRPVQCKFFVRAGKRVNKRLDTKERKFLMTIAPRTRHIVKVEHLYKNKLLPYEKPVYDGSYFSKALVTDINGLKWSGQWKDLRCEWVKGQ